MDAKESLSFTIKNIKTLAIVKKRHEFVSFFIFKRNKKSQLIFRVFFVKILTHLFKNGINWVIITYSIFKKTEVESSI